MKTPSSVEIGRSMKRARSSKKVTQGQLADRAKIPLRALRDAESGARPLHITRMWALADELDVTLDEYVGRVPPKYKDTPEYRAAIGILREYEFCMRGWDGDDE